MPDETQKLRLVVTVFYDMACLDKVLAALLALGLSGADLLLAGVQETMRLGSSIHTVLAAAGSAVQALAAHIAPMGELPGGLQLWASEGAVLPGRGHGDGMAAESCVDRLMSGEIGLYLRSHAEKGAVILIAKTLSPALQDRCVRAFLKNSRHTVHSCELSVTKASCPRLAGT
jgi:hypothetical protein